MDELIAILDARGEFTGKTEMKSAILVQEKVLRFRL